MKSHKISAIVLFVCLVFITSCAPVRVGPYYYPLYEGGEHKVSGQDCCGGVGPKAVLSINGPGNSKYIIRMTQNDEVLNGFIAVYLPKGSQFEISDRKAFFEFEDGNIHYEHQIIEMVYEEEISRDCISGIARGYLTADSQKLKKLPIQLKSGGKKGSAFWAKISLPINVSGNFRLTLPEVIIDGESFKPLPITFQPRDAGYYIYPLNC